MMIKLKLKLGDVSPGKTYTYQLPLNLPSLQLILKNCIPTNLPIYLVQHQNARRFSSRSASFAPTCCASKAIPLMTG